MPDPADYNSQDEFMSACVPMVMKEGKDQEAAAGQCMGMWNEKKSAEETKRGARNNHMDQRRIQDIHDMAVMNGAMCEPMKEIDPDALMYFGDTVKALGEGKVGGYLVRHSSAHDPDLTADFFDAKSEIRAPEILPVLYQHGFDARLGKRVIGDGKTRRDDVGLWIEAQLNLRDDYEKAVYELARSGKLGWSSGALSHLVEREPQGKATRIKTWFIGEASLTPTPAEYRNAVLPIKSLIPAESEAAETDKLEGETNRERVQIKETQTMNEEEKKALLDEVKSVFTAGLKEEVKAVAKDAAQEVIASLPEVKQAMNVTVTEAAEDRPFKSIADNLYAVKADVLSHGNADNQFPRLRFLKATGASEGVPADGGLLLDPTLTSEIIKPLHETGAFAPYVRRLPVGSNSNYGWINAVNETSRATGSRWGGIQGYRLAEAATKTASKPAFRRVQWELKKYAAVVVATDELLSDARMFSEIVRTGVTEELSFMLNDDIMNGVGIAGPQGFMNSGALITVARDTASKILGTDISAMYNRMDIRGRSNAIWFVGNDSQPQLDALFAVGSTTVLYPYASIGQDGVKRLYGRPIITTEFNQTLNTTGDIVFCDMSQYLLWEKGGIEESTSIHVYYLQDETAFRFVYRVDGKSSVNTALTPYKGTTTTSPFVSLTSAST